MKTVLVLCLAALALGGCQSRPLSTSVSPRVTGRVLAADTRQPLAGVKVIRDQPPEEPGSTEPPKGGQALRARAIVRTDRNGWFVLDSERVLAPFWKDGWFAVDLSFEHPGYERFQTNYSLLNLSTNSWQGQWALTAGDILLKPVPK
jgi:hypothetical protein